MHPLRRRIETSPTLIGLLGRGLAGWVRLCQRTAKWQDDGFDHLATALKDGPIILVMWHSRILMAPVHLEPHAHLTTLHDPSPAGHLAGAMQARFGMRSVAMSAKASNQGASREVLKRLKSGEPVGLTADGPLGPARVLKSAPLDWARVARVPVFFYAFATSRQWRAKSWDNMLIPRPWGRGMAAVARWEAEVPRKADPETLEALRQDMEASLDALQARVDAAVGLPPGP